jgi:hypothetical protein
MADTRPVRLATENRDFCLERPALDSYPVSPAAPLRHDPALLRVVVEQLAQQCGLELREAEALLLGRD